jgi:ABC-2 type transport system ATP-binding protein
MTDDVVVHVEHLRKVYGDVVAVDDVSFAIHRGEIFGIVGANGAGKTTVIECIEGSRKRDEGQIRILGLDIDENLHLIRPCIGIQSQRSGLQSRIKVWEVLDLFASFYEQPVDWQRLLAQVGLEEKRDARFGQLSGGQRQRLFVALALINEPEVLFLDELSTGLDPHARRAIWKLVEEIRESGRTIVLTTHSMEEAERLCDRVAIMDHGRIVALGSPQNLIRTLSGEARLLFTSAVPFEDEILTQLSSVSHVEQQGAHTVVFGRGNEFVSEVVETLRKENVHPADLRTEQSSLEDVFLAVTGQGPCN